MRSKTYVVTSTNSRSSSLAILRCNLQPLATNIANYLQSMILAMFSLELLVWLPDTCNSYTRLREQNTKHVRISHFFPRGESNGRIKCLE
jgi:hypothetical protein